MIQGVTLSPDGETIVYARRTIEKGKYRTRLWRAPWKGGRAEQLTFAEANDTRPGFSPDGGSLVFVSDRKMNDSKDAKPQLWTMPLNGGEPRVLTDLPEGAAAPAWSPDGSNLLFLAASGEQRFLVGKKEDPVARRIRDYLWRVDGVGVREQFTSAWVMPARPGAKPVRVTRPAIEVQAAFWSPDGRRVGFLADTRSRIVRFEIPQAWSVPLAGGRERPLASRPGGLWGAAWGDGGLAAIGIETPDPIGWERQVLYVLDGGDLRSIDGLVEETAGVSTYGDLIDESSSTPAPIAWVDHRHVAALVSRRGRSHVYRFGRDGSVEPLTEGDVVCTTLAVAAGRILVVANVGPDAGEAYAVEPGRELRRITTNGSRWFGPFRREPERIVAKHPEGHQVEGWLLEARGKRKAPLVVNVHGGPHAAHCPTPWMEMLALADAGFNVLWGNPRGSVGYGEDYGRAIVGAWGDADASDLLLLIDRVVRRGNTDRKRIGVLGLSYGGYMVHFLLGHFPGRFAVGVSENPVTDLVSEFGNSDYGTDIGRMATGKPLPSDSPEAWLDRSPYAQIHLNEAPLLLLQCEADLRCPPVNSEIPFAILKTLDREVEMVRYPDEAHAMFIGGRPDRRIDRLERIVGWFRQYLR
jgi:acylaminoacyl-peptidase